jgi:hypothetical protein
MCKYGLISNTVQLLKSLKHWTYQRGVWVQLIKLPLCLATILFSSKCTFWYNWSVSASMVSNRKRDRNLENHVQMNLIAKYICFPVLSVYSQILSCFPVLSVYSWIVSCLPNVIIRSHNLTLYNFCSRCKEFANHLSYLCQNKNVRSSIVHSLNKLPRTVSENLHNLVTLYKSCQYP